jgi:hypothetical protein
MGLWYARNISASSRCLVVCRVLATVKMVDYDRGKGDDCPIGIKFENDGG